MTSTWVLFLFLGFSQPLQVTGYSSLENCQQAGQKFIEERAQRMPHWRTGSDLGYCVEVR